MAVTRATLQGYMLEEVLAYLIRNTGYRLLVDESQDPDELRNRGQSLVVLGRGAEHQVDVLGELSWIPAFTYPLRLFVEAKFWKDPIGLPIVRNAVGTLLDVNQNNMPSTQNKEEKILRRKFQYVYALFSTSGFTEDAVDMAVAHNISLIDLNLDGFAEIRDAIMRSAIQIVETFNVSPPDKSKAISAETVKQVRTALRYALGTWPIDDESVRDDNLVQIQSLMQPISLSAQEYEQLFVGMAEGPHMLVLHADDPHHFLEMARREGRIPVAIRWTERGEGGKEERIWRITPAGDREENRFTLTFKLPDTLATYIFKHTTDRANRALNVKRRFFSTISLYHRSDQKDYLFRLEFDEETTRRLVADFGPKEKKAGPTGPAPSRNSSPA